MGKFTDEIASRMQQKRLFNEVDKDLKARIMSTVKTEIIPLLQNEYPSIDFKKYTAYLGETFPEGGFNLVFEVPTSKEYFYKLVNRNLNGVYEQIEREYGIKVSGFGPIFKFS
ncbi:MAG: hypothetical protein Q8R18_02065 [bacterium]|nr:hypothetical protein [bacterium]